MCVQEVDLYFIPFMFITNKLKIYVGNNMDEAAQLSEKAASEHK